ncbi:MAG TPA: carboxypeptidase regulatory-like domain-containing protein [Terriglobia bacterium]|nr:carboxypeptidase regulatory-like domain-containing protein [Terriglobia bacterium]
MRPLLAIFLLTAALAAQGPSGRRPQPGSISGRLFTHAGAPAAGVRVSALEVGSPLFPDSQALVSIAQTDSNGLYRLEDIPPGRYFITAGALDLPTFYPGADAAVAADVVTITPAANLAGVNFSLTVSTGLRFSGTLLRHDNNGNIVASPATTTTPTTQPLRIRLQGLNGAPSQMTVVAADGSFDFPQVRPGNYQINLQPSQARMPQMSVSLVDTDITDYKLIVPLMVQVTGTVTVEDGGPAPRFPIVFSNPNGPSPLFAESTSGVQQNITAQAGAPRFSVQVPVGANRVTASDIPNGFKVSRIVAGDVDLFTNPLIVTAAGAPPISIVLNAAAVPWIRVSGRVNGRSVYNGNPVNVTSTQGTLSPLPVTLYLDGSFEITRALPGAYRVGGTPGADLVIPAGIAEVRGAVIDIGADSAGAALPTDRPSSAVRVAGRVVGRARALQGVQARIENSETGDVRTAPIYVDGSFEFQNVQPGEYVARVTPAIPGAAPTSFTVGTRDIGDVQLTVPSFRDIAGRVRLDGSGTLPRNLTFVAASSPILAEIREDGRFTVSLPNEFPVTLAADSLPERYAVSALKYGNVDLLQEPLLLAGPDNTLSVTLRTPLGAAAVRGRVTGDVAALGEVRVWLTDTAGKQRALETTPGVNGAFAFSAVGEGNYTVSLAPPGIPANAVSAAITVTGGQDVAELNLPAPRAVRGRVTVEGVRPPDHIRLQLNGGAAGVTTIAITPRPDGSFTVFLPTGDRTAGIAAGLPADVAVRAMTYGSTDLLTNPLRVPDSGPLEELTIRLAPASR